MGVLESLNLVNCRDSGECENFDDFGDFTDFGDFGNLRNFGDFANFGNFEEFINLNSFLQSVHMTFSRNQPIIAPRHIKPNRQSFSLNIVITKFQSNQFD